MNLRLAIYVAELFHLTIIIGGSYDGSYDGRLSLQL